MMSDLQGKLSDAALRFVVGAVAPIGVGFLLCGSQIFDPKRPVFAYTALGLGVALIYGLFKLPQRNYAYMVSFFEGVAISIPATRNRLGLLIITVAVPCAMILLCDTLTKLKDLRPVHGKLLLLGPVFAIVYTLLTLALAISETYRGWLTTLLFETKLFFSIGVSLGIGL